jgi:hypothetical protein
MNHQRLQPQREALAGKIVIGIDLAKDKQQAAVVDAHGNACSHVVNHYNGNIIGSGLTGREGPNVVQ